MEVTDTPSAVAEPRRPSGRRLWLFRALLILPWLAVPLVAEIALRISGDMNTWLENNGQRYQSPYEWRNRDPWRHRFTPSSEFRMQQPEFSFDVRINSLGLRDVEHPIEKPATEYRIVALGDSFTYGQGAAFEDTYPSRLQSVLNADGPRKEIRVINAGVPGSDPVFNYEMLRRDLLDYAPDAVILLVNRSDLADVVTRGGFDRFDSRGVVIGPPAPRLEWLYARSHLVRWIAHTALGYDHLVLSPGESERRRRESLDVLREAIRRYDALAREHGMDLLVVAQPDAGQIHVDDREYALLATLGDEVPEGVRFLDLREYLRDRVPEDRIDDYFWTRDSHCNAAGYALFAEAIASEVRGFDQFPGRADVAIPDRSGSR